ncbi:Bestrophin-like protein [Aphelenchoides fujianensis]|nr:Bestrophin-like protein [Aphelenchoides fujianensis]
MSITYSLDVSSASFCGLHRLLFRWRGSIWKAILPELCVWLLGYALISCCYRWGMTEEQQKVFEQLWIDYVNNVGWIEVACLRCF